MSSFLNLVPAQCQAMTVSAMAVVAVRSVAGFVRLTGAVGRYPSLISIT
jgi:hypothetical protein